MRNYLSSLHIMTSVLLLAGCATNKVESKLDCRDLLKDDFVQKEIQLDLETRFPHHLEAYTSIVGLLFDDSGTRYYPVMVKTKDNRTYSIIYSYSPKNELCKKIGFQYIQLESKH